jgi:hypothetical protein
MYQDYLHLSAGKQVSGEKPDHRKVALRPK